MDTEKLLSEVEKAIVDIVRGRAQSVQINGELYTSLDLDKLKNLRSELIAEVVRGSQTDKSVFVRPVFRK